MLGIMPSIENALAIVLGIKSRVEIQIGPCEWHCQINFPVHPENPKT